MLQYEDYKRASGKQRHEPHDLDNTQNQQHQQTRVPCVSQEMLHRILQTHTHTHISMCVCVYKQVLHTNKTTIYQIY